MGDYFIDPMVFYWINVFNGVHVLGLIVGSIFFVGLFVAICAYIGNKYASIEYGGDKYTAYVKMCKTIIAITAIVGITFIAVGIFAPDTDTCVKMLVTKTVTKGNVEWTIEQVKEIVDYIAQKIGGGGV